MANPGPGPGEGEGEGQRGKAAQHVPKLGIAGGPAQPGPKLGILNPPPPAHRPDGTSLETEQGNLDEDTSLDGAEGGNAPVEPPAEPPNKSKADDGFTYASWADDFFIWLIQHITRGLNQIGARIGIAIGVPIANYEINSQLDSERERTGQGLDRTVTLSKSFRKICDDAAKTPTDPRARPLLNEYEQYNKDVAEYKKAKTTLATAYDAVTTAKTELKNEDMTAEEKKEAKNNYKAAKNNYKAANKNYKNAKEKAEGSKQRVEKLAVKFSKQQEADRKAKATADKAVNLSESAKKIYEGYEQAQQNPNGPLKLQTLQYEGYNRSIAEYRLKQVALEQAQRNAVAAKQQLDSAKKNKKGSPTPETQKAASDAKTAYQTAQQELERAQEAYNKAKHDAEVLKKSVEEHASKISKQQKEEAARQAKETKAREAKEKADRAREAKEQEAREQEEAKAQKKRAKAQKKRA